MSDGWFPSLSPDGLSVATGSENVYVDGTMRVLLASGPRFRDDRYIYYTVNSDALPNDGAIRVFDRSSGATADLLPPGYEGWSLQNGRFAAWTRNDRVKAITMSRDGHRAGLVDVGNGRDVILEVDGVEIDRGPIAEPRYGHNSEALVWTKFVDGVRRVYGRRSHGAPTDPLSVRRGSDYWPIPIETTEGLFLLTHGSEPADGLFLWKWGTDEGYRRIVGETSFPDARQLADGRMRIVYSTGGEPGQIFIALSEPRINLREGSTPPPPPPPPPPPGENFLRLEAKHSQLIEAYAERFGMPGLSHAAGQEWIKGLAETFAARFPGEGWGRKRADSGRPISNESIARKFATDGDRDGRADIVSYDLIVGAGAAGQTLNSQAHPEDIDDQVFVSVDARDHLASSNPPPPPDSPPPPPPQPSARCQFQQADLASLAFVVSGLANGMVDLANKVDAMAENLQAQRDRYEAVEEHSRLIFTTAIDRVLRILRSGFSFRVLGSTVNGAFRDRAEA